MTNKMSILTSGILKENPVLVLLLGTCPSLAVTSMAINGIGMGAATTLVLLGSNIAISLLKNWIPDRVRIPSYVAIIAGFVTIVGFLVKAFSPELDKALGIFLPLIVVNCIILGRAEMFASKNNVVSSTLDAIGMGVGFTVALFAIGSVREILGMGSWLGISLTDKLFAPISIFTLAPGGFLVFGFMVAAVNYFTKGRAIKKKEFGCAGCPMASNCVKAVKGE